ncbi:hypothetical protein VNO80_24653 [Phaseolus coccineus]|uniref:RRM domain-containing protein n=1 Tax=Phaseolus coccineus TaxID=3886 RepID=A0AAN9LTB7_PHACN
MSICLWYDNWHGCLYQCVVAIKLIHAIRNTPECYEQLRLEVTQRTKKRICSPPFHLVVIAESISFRKEQNGLVEIALAKGNPLLFPLSRFLCVRHHSSANLFVAGLSWDTNEPILRDAFEQHGEIIEVRVICDHVTGKSRGYGLVRFVSETTAATARKEMNGQILDGRRIRVSYAHKR